GTVDTAAAASMPAEALRQRAAVRGPAGPLGFVVHPGEGALDVAHAEPAQRLRLPGGGSVPDDRQSGQRGRSFGEKVGEGAPGQVRGGDTMAGVAARRGDARGAVVGDRG